MLKSNNITPTRKMFNFSDSSWDDDHDTSRSTGGYLIFYEGRVIDHSSNMPTPIAMSRERQNTMNAAWHVWQLEIYT